MALIVMPSLLSKRPWARIRARCEASFFIILSKSARCCSVRGHTYLTIIHLGSGFTYRIVLKLSREILYQKTFGRALIAPADIPSLWDLCWESWRPTTPHTRIALGTF